MKWLWIPILALTVVALLPLSSATPSLAPPPAKLPTPIHGVATACTNPYTCTFTMHTSKGNGSASTSYYGIKLLLPGEANTTLGTVSYQTIPTNNSSLASNAGAFTVQDVNSGKMVLGSTHTNLTRHAHCVHTGCTYTYNLINGTIFIQRTNADGTSMSVSCNPSSIVPGQTTVCTAWVNDTANASKHPTGTLTFSNYLYAYGSFSHGGKCTLVSGHCSVKFTAYDETNGGVTIVVTYPGTGSYWMNSARGSVYVNGN